MRSSLKSAILIAALTVASSSLATQNPVGTWKGSLQITMPTLPANLTAQQKKAIEDNVTALKKATVTITFKADKTYSAATKGMPNVPDEKEKGTWVLKGDKVTLTDEKKQVQTLTFSPDGKTLVIVFPSQPGKGSAKAVFKRV